MSGDEQDEKRAKIMENMNRAAEAASKDLRDSKAVSEQSIKEVGAWWAKWYLEAGHKRLGRILLAAAKVPKGSFLSKEE